MSGLLRPHTTTYDLHTEPERISFSRTFKDQRGDHPKKALPRSSAVKQKSLCALAVIRRERPTHCSKGNASGREFQNKPTWFTSILSVWTPSSFRMQHSTLLHLIACYEHYEKQTSVSMRLSGPDCSIPVVLAKVLGLCNPTIFDQPIQPGN